MQKRFHELVKQRDSIFAASKPKREARDLLVNQNRAQEQVLDLEIKEIEAGLFDIQNTLGAISRALGGQTGEPPAE